MPTRSHQQALSHDQDLLTTGAASEKASFNGPGGASASTTASVNLKPDSREILEKLDPKYDTGIVEAQPRGDIKEGDKKGVRERETGREYGMGLRIKSFARASK
ncbi:hypothetical protein BJX66DRAFT_340106 [Aspergillus keveii]|uniref:Uncharacterized protein n=1 Tax=Aspergillus keveii TaxID=714993 RepID=A0ABR4FZ55_9EURO